LSDIEPQAVEALLDAAFGTDRFGRTAYRIRAGADAVPALSFALVEDGALVGTIQCWPVAHRAPGGAATPLVMVGPVAVRPDVQRGGHGRALMAHMLEAAETKADSALMMIGDPEYYGRFFGFDADATGAWDLPGPYEKRRLLARAVNGHALPTGAGMIGPR
jgi:predicted N-acetyltransferase YhbS